MIERINEGFNKSPDWVKWMAIPTYFVIGVLIVALYPFYGIFKIIQGVKDG